MFESYKILFSWFNGRVYPNVHAAVTARGMVPIIMHSIDSKEENIFLHFWNKADAWVMIQSKTHHHQ